MDDRANGGRRRERTIMTTTGNILHFLHHPSFHVYAYLHGRKNVISLKRMHVMNSLVVVASSHFCFRCTTIASPNALSYLFAFLLLYSFCA